MPAMNVAFASGNCKIRRKRPYTYDKFIKKQQQKKTEILAGKNHLTHCIDLKQSLNVSIQVCVCFWMFAHFQMSGLNN